MLALGVALPVSDPVGEGDRVVLGVPLVLAVTVADGDKDGILNESDAP
jgi:hypothetical protein